MREFCAKCLSYKALHRRVQTLFRKRNNKSQDNDLNNGDATTVESEKKSKLTKIKQGVNNFVGGFRVFLFHGERIQLAVALIVAGIFGRLVDDFTSGFITPWLGVIFGETEFDALSFTINGSKFPCGRFIDTLLTLILIAILLYFAIVLPSKWLTEKLTKNDETNQTSCVYCCSIISIKAIRCPFCTSILKRMPEITSFERTPKTTNSETITINEIASEGT